MKLSRICKGNKAAGMRCYCALFPQYAYISGILRLTLHQRWRIVRHIILYTHAPLPFHQTSSLEGRWHVQSPGRSGRTPPLSAIGLLPRKRGPKQPHKLKPTVLAQLRELASSQPDSGSKELARALRQRFRVKLHPRTVEKALHAKAKKGLRSST